MIRISRYSSYDLLLGIDYIINLLKKVVHSHNYAEAVFNMFTFLWHPMKNANEWLNRAEIFINKCYIKHDEEYLQSYFNKYDKSDFRFT